MMSDDDTQKVSAFYRSLYNKDMFAAIDSDVSGSADWARLVKAWMKG